MAKFAHGKFIPALMKTNTQGDDSPCCGCEDDDFQNVMDGVNADVEQVDKDAKSACFPPPMQPHTQLSPHSMVVAWWVNHCWLGLVALSMPNGQKDAPQTWTHEKPNAKQKHQKNFSAKHLELFLSQKDMSDSKQHHHAIFWSRGFLPPIVLFQQC